MIICWHSHFLHPVRLLAVSAFVLSRLPERATQKIQSLGRLVTYTLKKTQTLDGCPSSLWTRRASSAIYQGGGSGKCIWSLLPLLGLEAGRGEEP